MVNRAQTSTRQALPHTLKKTLAALAVTQALAAPLQAATLTVNTLGDTLFLADNVCTLREALSSIASGTPRSDCPNSGGSFGVNDRIQTNLSAGTITLGSALGIGSLASPVIVEIDLNGITVAPNNGNRAFAIDSSIVTLNNMVIANANITGSGGAIDVNYSTLAIRNSSLINNNASSRGGAIYAKTTSLVTVEDSEFTNNTAQIGGAISLQQSSRVELKRSLLTNNRANLSSGAVHGRRDSEIFSENSVFYRNSAGTFGGAIYLQEESTSLLINTTLNQNSAGFNGGGIFVFQDSALSLSASIIASSINNDCYVASNSVLASDTYSILQDGTCNTIARAIDPQLQTTFALTNSSPARDTGPTLCPATDQRDQGRVDGSCDVGAFEFNELLIEVNSTVDNGLGCGLRQAINSTADNLLSTCQNAVDGVLFNDGTQTIRFAPNLAGSTLPLSYGQISIQPDQDVLIDASQLASGIIVDAQNSQRHFSIDQGTLSLNSLNLINGSENGYGGSVIVNGGTLTIADSSLSNNNAQRGGAIAARFGATLHIETSVISGNSASSNGYSGGGIYLANSQLRSESSTLADNSAAGRGGGITFNLSSAFILDSTISGNSSAQGGGLSLKESYAYFSNATVSGNTANVGGGIYAFRSSSAILSHATLANNSSPGGGGITLDFSTADFLNSIIAGSNGNDCYDAGDSTINSAGTSIVQDGSCGGMMLNPGLLPLTNNGGPTKTHVLRANSPAIGIGTLEHCTGEDQRGVDRQKQINGCDLGATEFQSSDVPVNFFVIPLPNGRTLTFAL